MTDATFAAWRDFALQHLPSDIAQEWLGLLRPAVRLKVDAESDVVAGQLGGLPRLPEGQEWPVWEGHGPLSLIASVDCAQLPSAGSDLPLPREGTLLFFFFDGQLDDHASWSWAHVRDSRSGARVLYVPEGAEAPVRDAPAELRPFPVLPLTAQAIFTAPDAWHSRTRAAFAPEVSYPDDYSHPVSEEEFVDALIEFECEDDADCAHQIGGYADDIQDPVEREVDEEHADEWVLLAQFDGEDDADMIWGDSGMLYWLIRPRDLAELRFDRAMFTWQTC
ncbi:YwqG family protein [Streptomyces sulphureus]|uniref:YwqG family protein n=1 Tax=Streptomyces sulphureus TaxID=47758 RepID=UPI000D0AACB9|nr:YwqG family protein [Streptomyces sulphureus]